MARLVFGMMQSLDGYVDGPDGGLALPPPGATLGRHFTNRVRECAGALYGRRIYQIMQYWDIDQPNWDDDDVAFATAWRACPKWVVSRTLHTVGPNAVLIDARGEADLERAVQRLRGDVNGEIDVAGPRLAGALTALGLIDEYRLYFRPYVLGAGLPFFVGARPSLHLRSSERVGEDSLLVTCVPLEPSTASRR